MQGDCQELCDASRAAVCGQTPGANTGNRRILGLGKRILLLLTSHIKLKTVSRRCERGLVKEYPPGQFDKVMKNSIDKTLPSPFFGKSRVRDKSFYLRKTRPIFVLTTVHKRTYSSHRQ
jgi:hypothetical protein